MLTSSDYNVGHYLYQSMFGEGRIVPSVLWKKGLLELSSHSYDELGNEELVVYLGSLTSHAEKFRLQAKKGSRGDSARKPRLGLGGRRGPAAGQQLGRGAGRGPAGAGCAPVCLPSADQTVTTSRDSWLLHQFCRSTSCILTRVTQPRTTHLSSRQQYDVPTDSRVALMLPASECPHLGRTPSTWCRQDLWLASI